MEWLLVAVLTVAIMAIAARSLRRLRAQEQADSPSRAPAAHGEPPAAGAETLQDLAQALLPAYEASAHPQDLQSHPAFQRGVAWLAEPAVPLEQVVSYCAGANM